MTDHALDLDAIRQRADAATPGVWIHRKIKWGKSPIHVVVDGPQSIAYAESEGADAAVFERANSANSEFIAHARHDVPALLDEVERLKSEMRMRELHHFEEEQKRIEAEAKAERLRIQLAAVIRFAQPGTHSLEDVAEEFGVDLDDQEGKS